MEKNCIAVMLPTKKESNLFLFNGELLIRNNPLDKTFLNHTQQYIYILSDDKIEEGDWCILDWEGKMNPDDIRIGKAEFSNSNFGIRNQFGNLSVPPNDGRFTNHKKYKIIATTDAFLDVSKEVKSFKDWHLFPNLQKSFIEEFVSYYNKTKKNKIDVLVEIYKDVQIIESGDNYDDNIVVVNGEKVFTWTHEQPERLELEANKYRNKARVYPDNTINIRLKN